MAESPGNIGKYYALKVVGSGNTAVVYHGYDPFNDQDVAIKVSNEKLESTNFPGSVTRTLFYNEAQAAGALIHPNIVRVLDAGEHDGSPYLVMDYVRDGKTLDKFCNGREILPIRQIGQIIYHCARALDYSHRHGVIHRDIKASNILMTSRGQAKITDFGIAQRTTTEQTDTVELMGTPAYMSPEQVRQEELNVQTDVYSLGVVMYEMLTGQTPFRANTVTGLMYRILNDPLPAPVLKRPVSEEVKNILTTALAKDRNERFKSAGEMAEAVFEAFDGIKDTGETISEQRKLHYVRRLEFFNQFDNEQLREILANGSWNRHAPGETIFLEGSMEIAFYTIVAGHVEVRKNSEVLCRLPAGSCFGEMGYLTQTGRTASIVAGEPVWLLALNANTIKLASTMSQLKFNEAFIRTLVGRLAVTSETLVNVTKLTNAGTEVI